MDENTDYAQQISKVITQRIRMEGFIVFDHRKNYAEARKQLAQWLAEGKIKRQETIVKGGLKVAEQALVDLFKGGNTGEYFFFTKTSSTRLTLGREITCGAQSSRDTEQAVRSGVSSVCEQ